MCFFEWNLFFFVPKYVRNQCEDLSSSDVTIDYRTALAYGMTYTYPWAVKDSVTWEPCMIKFEQGDAVLFSHAWQILANPRNTDPATLKCGKALVEWRWVISQEKAWVNRKASLYV